VKKKSLYIAHRSPKRLQFLKSRMSFTSRGKSMLRKKQTLFCTMLEAGEKGIRSRQQRCTTLLITVTDTRWGWTSKHKYRFQKSFLLLRIYMTLYVRNELGLISKFPGISTFLVFISRNTLSWTGKKLLFSLFFNIHPLFCSFHTQGKRLNKTSADFQLQLSTKY